MKISGHIVKILALVCFANGILSLPLMNGDAATNSVTTGKSQEFVVKLSNTNVPENISKLSIALVPVAANAGDGRKELGEVDASCDKTQCKFTTILDAATTPGKYFISAANGDSVVGTTDHFDVVSATSSETPVDGNTPKPAVAPTPGNPLPQPAESTKTEGSPSVPPAANTSSGAGTGSDPLTVLGNSNIIFAKNLPLPGAIWHPGHFVLIQYRMKDSAPAVEKGPMFRLYAADGKGEPIKFKVGQVSKNGDAEGNVVITMNVPENLQAGDYNLAINFQMNKEEDMQTIWRRKVTIVDAAGKDQTPNASDSGEPTPGTNTSKSPQMSVKGIPKQNDPWKSDTVVGLVLEPSFKIKIDTVAASLATHSQTSATTTAPPATVEYDLTNGHQLKLSQDASNPSQYVLSFHIPTEAQTGKYDLTAKLTKEDGTVQSVIFQNLWIQNSVENPSADSNVQPNQTAGNVEKQPQPQQQPNASEQLASDVANKAKDVPLPEALTE